MRIRSVAISAFVVLAGCYDWTVVPKGASDGGDAGGSTKKQDCKTNAECGPAAYCAFSDGKCGAGQIGTCLDVPPAESCSAAAPEQICGCDGQVRSSICAASAERVDVSATGPCAFDPASSFRCGFAVCPKTSYCLEVVEPDYLDYVCIKWTCAERTCACAETSAKCKGTCETEPGGGTIVRCGR